MNKGKSLNSVWQNSWYDKWFQIHQCFCTHPNHCRMLSIDQKAMHITNLLTGESWTAPIVSQNPLSSLKQVYALRMNGWKMFLFSFGVASILRCKLFCLRGWIFRITEQVEVDILYFFSFLCGLFFSILKCKALLLPKNLTALFGPQKMDGTYTGNSLLTP